MIVSVLECEGSVTMRRDSFDALREKLRQAGVDVNFWFVDYLETPKQQARTAEQGAAT